VVQGGERGREKFRELAEEGGGGLLTTGHDNICIDRI
jgi:hypothetical protein